MYDWGWNWDGAIERNRGVLLRVLMGLFALVRISASGGAHEKLPRHVRSYIIKLLRPAESAGRRLIVLYSLVHSYVENSDPFEAPLGTFTRADFAW